MGNRGRIINNMAAKKSDFNAMMTIENISVTLEKADLLAGELIEASASGDEEMNRINMLACMVQDYILKAQESASSYIEA